MGEGGGMDLEGKRKTAGLVARSIIEMLKRKVRLIEFVVWSVSSSMVYPTETEGFKSRGQYDRSQEVWNIYRIYILWEGKISS